MLLQINLQHYIAISQQQLNLQHGFICLTGETGAGKSIWIDAIAIGLGARCDKSIIQVGAKQCIISLEFDIRYLKTAQNYLAQAGFIKQQIPSARTTANESEKMPISCIIRRQINQQGRSSFYINDTPCTLRSIKQLSMHLIQHNGQHQQLSLQQPIYQQAWIDQQLPQAAQLQLKQVKKTHRLYQQLTQQLAPLLKQQEIQQQEYALLCYQLDELMQFCPQENEWEQLQITQKTLQQQSELTQISHQCHQLLCADNNASPLQCIQQGIRLLAPFVKTNKSTLEHEKGNTTRLQINNILQNLEQAEIALQEADSDLQQLKHAQQHNNTEQKTEIENRLNAWYELSRKHRIPPAQLSSHLNALKEQLSAGDKLKHAIEKIKQQQAECLTEWQQQAQLLSIARKKIAPKLAKKITQYMQQLAMQHSYCEIDFKTQNTQPYECGIDRMELLISTNPKQAPQSLQQVASGGELSRIALALAVIHADKSERPCLVFDEIDNGIGGHTARIVAKLLAKISQQQQVLCITHLPQVAMHADQHILVHKHITANKELCMKASTLNKTQREIELTRMLGGDEMNAAARQQVKDLLREKQPTDKIR